MKNFVLNNRRVGLLAALILAPAAARAQDPATNTVGPPVLRDFSLEGERTIQPPPPAQTQPAAQPPSRETRAAPPVATPQPARDRVAPRPTGQVPAAPPPAATDAAPLPTVETQPELILPEAAPDSTLPPQEAAPAPAAPAGTSFPWLYALLAALGVGALLLLLRRRAASRRPEVRTSYVPRPAPEPVQPAAPAGPRARLELEFKPGKAAATDVRTTLDFELVIRNVGEVPAGNIRIEARMFNAGKQQDTEIRAFFAAPDGATASRAAQSLPPGANGLFRGGVAMPKEDVREVVVQGRRLFIPMVAFNILYEWEGGGSGQTSMSYLVGRETQPPAEKMAPFRLDLGPRIYRSVGFRPNKLALTV